MRVLRYVLAFSVMLFCMPFVAYAADAVVVDDGGILSMIVGAMPSLINVLPAWVGVVVSVLYAIAHLIATLPVGITARWPSWLKSLINLLAANYGKARNKDG